MSKRLTTNKLRALILQEVRESRRSSSRAKSTTQRHVPRLSSVLFEADVEDIAQQEAKPVTLVVLYGPPAAGKGAAKSAVGKFAGVDAETNFKDWLKSLGKEDAASFFQEEDETMVKAMTKTLPPLVFSEIAGRVSAGEDFNTVVEEYYHINEKGETFNLEDILSKSAFDKLMKDSEGNVEAAAKEFAAFPNTNAYFTQARGFSKQIQGADEELNAVLGATNDEGQTLGVRAKAAGQYMDDVKAEIKAMGAKQVGDTTYASVYLMDQAGESTADTNRIAALGKLKEDPDFPAVTIVGVYIHQPKERTTIANLHRAATGGRRVAQSEVDRIFAAGPEMDGKEIKKQGKAIEAMMDNFDQVHLYYPQNPFEPEDAKEISGKICNPLGPEAGALDIEGCEDVGQRTATKSLAGMEKQAAKKADVEDLTDDEGLPKPDALDDTQKEKVVQALNDMGFKTDVAGLEKYLTTIRPPEIRGGGEHGKVPWATELFGDEYMGDDATVTGRSPDQHVQLKPKSESVKNTDELILERWRKLAGLL